MSNPDNFTFGEIAKSSSPANAPAKSVERSRIPMSIPQLRLAVPEIPGYHLHWFRGALRVAQALRAGYEHVDFSEVDIPNTGLADDASATGSTDMGTRVSVNAGSELEAGQEQRLYLMKIRQEWWEADQQLLANRNEEIAASLRGGKQPGSNPHGDELTYIPDVHRKGVETLFTPKKRRA